MAAVVLTWKGSTPGQTQYGLATLVEHYKVQNDDGTQITAGASGAEIIQAILNLEKTFLELWR